LVTLRDTFINFSIIYYIMVAVVKKLLVLLLPLVAIPIVFAQSISIQVAGKVYAASLGYIQQHGLFLTVNLYYSGDLSYVAGGTGYLKVYVIYENGNYGNGKIVYQDVVPVSVNNFTTMQYYIPGNVFSAEGEYDIKFIYQVPTTDEGLLEAGDDFVMVVSNVMGEPLIILGVYPNLTGNETLSFGRTLVNFMVEVYNPANYAQYVSAEIDLLDQQGNLILSQTGSGFILPGQRGSITVPVNFLSVQPGIYTLVLKVFRGGFEEVRYQNEVIIGADQYLPVYVYSITQYPYVVRPGDFVEFTLLLKNKGEPTQVVVIMNSTELNLYKETGTIDFDTNEVKEIKLVIRVPEDINGGKYPIQFTVQSGVATHQYIYYLNVEPVENTAPIKIEFIEPTKLVVGNYSEAELMVWSNTEDLETYTLNIEASGAEVMYNNTFTIGGIGESIELPVIIKPLSSSISLNITVYDSNGNIVYEGSEELKAKTVIDIRYYVSLALSIVVIIIVAILIGYLLKEENRKGGKKRKVEEAE